jgi:APA family basic amino acid/polyamine antiporter
VERQPTIEVRREAGLATAFAVIVSNMVGTGVFTSLGFQVTGTRTGFALLALWAVGGLVALAGALCYAELGAAMPQSGGEYVYLGRAYSPFLGFLGGWVSMTVGFAAPIALAALAFGRYLSAVVPVPPLLASALLLVAIGTVHAANLRLAHRFQVTVTTLELALIAGFLVAGLAHDTPEFISFAPTAAALGELGTPSFAVSLIYVSFAYSGWNAAGYMAGEIARPERVVPRALVAGTLVVTGLYLALNWTFLRTVPVDRLAGVVEVGALSATELFGRAGGRIMSGIFAALLVATVSAMVLAGSRVTEAVTRDLATLARLGARSAGGVPRNAILLQVGVTLLLLFTNSVEKVMAYAGFTLSLAALAAVVGVSVLRRREPGLPRPYRTWGYPYTPIFFVAASLWTLAFVLAERPAASLAGLATVGLGAAIYWWDRIRARA